jgi:hypothetical protein
MCSVIRATSRLSDEQFARVQYPPNLLDTHASYRPPQQSTYPRRRLLRSIRFSTFSAFSAASNVSNFTWPFVPTRPQLRTSMTSPNNVGRKQSL